jgi:hypothetical protein
MATVFLVTVPFGDDLSQNKTACRTREGADRVVDELVKQHVEFITVEEIRYEDNNVMRCKAETCSNLFVRVRRQLYCSKSCAQKVRSKVWYARHGEEKRRKNREAYRKAHHA